ncbi:hypothetical protein ACHWQZ_G010761 [Mnemiopsis leidyi]
MMIKNCRKTWTPLANSVRTMAVGYDYKYTNKRCWFDETDKQNTVVRIPYRERDENMKLQDRWHYSTIERIFENNHTIVAFHMKYIPRINFEQKLDWDLLESLSGTSVQGNCYPRHCVVKYLRQSRFVHMIPLFQERTGILYTNDVNEVQAICKALKKTQYTKHLILGGLLNGKLHGPNTFTEIAEMDDLQSEQAKLVGLLSTAGAGLIQTLSQPSAMLSLVLENRNQEPDS